LDKNRLYAIYKKKSFVLSEGGTLHSHKGQGEDMVNARLGKEVYVETPDEVGMLAKISTVLAGAGINIQAICGYGEGGKAKFRIVTSDNKKTMDTLKPLKFTMKEQEIVFLELEDKTGAISEVCRKLSSEKANLTHIYGTTSSISGKSLLIISSNDNVKIAKLFV